MVDVAQTGNLLESFTEFTRETAAVPDWLHKLRGTAFARFCAVGFPTLKDEDWRFTSVAPIARTAFKLAHEEAKSFAVSDLARWRMKDAAARLVFWNGRFAPALSTWGELPEGVTANGLAKEIELGTEELAARLGRYLDVESDPFNALNTAFARDGAFVHVRRGVVVKQPIHLLFVAAPEEGAPTMVHPRNLVVVDDQAEASIVEEYVSAGGAASMLTNAVTEIVAGESATVSHLAVKRENLETYHVATLRIDQARSANVHSHTLLLGGALARNNVHPVLNGEGGDCLINGLYVGSGRQHLDNYMLVEHAKPYCSSRQFYNGILDDQSHGVFHGRIVVHKDAQKTDAKQTNRNLLLSDDAQIDSKPQLEIYADDVKCTHGATTGQIDEGALFYLRSRGISEIEARQLLLTGFARECLERMKPGADRDYAEAAVGERLTALAGKQVEGA